MLNMTNIFVNEQNASNSYVNSIFDRVQKVYKVDDCDITISNSKANVNDGISKLVSNIGNEGVLQVIKNFRSSIRCNIPVMTFEEYLKEIKDCVQESNDGSISIGNLTRVIIPINDYTVVANVIIVGKDDCNGAILINELFENDKYVKTVEYKVDELLKSLEKLSEPTNIIDKHKIYMNSTKVK